MIYHLFLEQLEFQVTNYKNKSRKELINWGDLHTGMMPNYIPDPSYWTVARATTMTDILSCFRSSGFFFNEKVKNIIEQNQLILPPHCIFPAQMKYRGTFYEYYFLHIKFEDRDFFDFPNTVLRPRANGIGSLNPQFLDIGLPKVNNLEEYRTLSKDMKETYPHGIGITDICLKLDKPYDFLSVRCNFFISDKFLALLHKNDITGYRIEKNTLFRHNFM